MKKLIEIINTNQSVKKEDYISLGEKLTKYVNTKTNEDEKLMLYEMIGTHFEEQDEQRDWIIEGAKKVLIEDNEIKIMADGINQIRLYTEVLRNNLEELKNLNFDSPEVKSMVKTLQELLSSLDEKNKTKETFNKTSYRYN